MTSLVSFTVLGLFTGAAYAIAAGGLVLTYTATRVFDIAHGAFGMVMRSCSGTSVSGRACRTRTVPAPVH